MTDQRPKIAALVADAFQEEEYFFPKVALNEAGYQVEVVSSRKQPVEIYSYFARTGLLDVDRAIAEAGVIACVCRGSMLAARLQGCCRPSHDGVQRQRLLPRTGRAARRRSRRCNLGAGCAGRRRSQPRHFAASALFRGFLGGDHRGVTWQVIIEALHGK
jgi:hypothetical protein